MDTKQPLWAKLLPFLIVLGIVGIVIIAIVISDSVFCKECIQNVIDKVMAR